MAGINPVSICDAKKVLSAYLGIPDQYIANDFINKDIITAIQNKPTLYFSEKSVIPPLVAEEIFKDESLIDESSSSTLLGRQLKAGCIFDQKDYEVVAPEIDFNVTASEITKNYPSTTPNPMSILSLENKISSKIEIPVMKSLVVTEKDHYLTKCEDKSADQLGVCSEDKNTDLVQDNAKETDSNLQKNVDNIQPNQLGNFLIFNSHESFKMAFEKVKRETLTAYCVVMSSRNFSKHGSYSLKLFAVAFLEALEFPEYYYKKI